jgi:hypothetical protein
MDLTAIKRVKVSETLLKRAIRKLAKPSNEASAEYKRLLSECHSLMERNDHERALDTLISIGSLVSCRGGFWRDLERAAENMGLVHRLPELRKRFADAPVPR